MVKPTLKKARMIKQPAWEIEPISLSERDQGFRAVSEWCANKIASAYGIPKTLMSDQTNKSLAEDEAQ